MATKQYKQLGCLDVDPKAGCGIQVRPKRKRRCCTQVALHAKQCHKLEALPPEMAAKVKAGSRP